MRELVRQAMREGAVGLSTSLQYPPAPYAETPELIALASGGGEARRSLRHATCGPRATRSSRRIDEAIRIGREAGIPVEIWHLKAAGQAELGPDAGDRGQDRLGPPGRSGHRRRHLRLSGVVQLALGIRSALGPRRGHGQAARSACAIPRPARRISDRSLEDSRPGTTAGRRSRARGDPDRRGAEPGRCGGTRARRWPTSRRSGAATRSMCCSIC